MSTVVVTVYRQDSAVPIAIYSDFVALRASRIISGIGVMALTLAIDEVTFALQPDLRFVVNREAGGYTHLFGGYLLRRWVQALEDGRETVTLYGLCYNSLLERRIVAYKAGTAQASKTGAADDILKAVIRENLGSSAGTGRDITSYGLSVEADLSQCQSIEAGFAYRKLNDVAQQITEIAWGKNSERLYWDVTPTDVGWTMEFRARKDLTATDRRMSSSNPLWISPEVGAVNRVVIDYDRADEINWVMGGGRGEGADRETVTVSDDARIAESVINRHEAFFDGASYDTTNGLTDASKRKLREGLPRIVIDTELTETDDIVYGRDFEAGSLLTVQALGTEYDVFVRGAQVTVDANRDDLSLMLEAV